jgi:DNA-binding transcriptional ArsR family regulator
MSAHSTEVQTRLAIEGSEPIVIDAETALDEMFRALANERRRRVLCVLYQESTPIDVKSLAREVTVQKAANNSETVTEESIRRTRISLHHKHLPVLADLGFIDYDAEKNIIEVIGNGISSVD